MSPLLRRARRAAGRAIGGFLLAFAKVAPHVPDGLSLWIADALGLFLYTVNARGRKAGMENLRAVFGDEMSVRERRRVLRGSYRNALRSAWALFHLRPLTPERYARWVTVTPEDEAYLRRISRDVRSGVIVSGHFGNWELLLASRTGLPFSPKIAYLVEQTPVPELDAAVDRLRDRGGGSGALRKGGSGRGARWRSCAPWRRATRSGSSWTGTSGRSTAACTFPSSGSPRARRRCP
jgi:lauroyl/myristoyl acyltransferase